jgi:hypothetical protein
MNLKTKNGIWGHFWVYPFEGINIHIKGYSSEPVWEINPPIPIVAQRDEKFKNLN